MKTIARFSAAVILCAAGVAFAQDYPTKPIRVIVPLTPGSGADIAGRIVAKYLGDALKQPVLVENRPGAGGIIGTQAMLNADADGHTLMVQSASHAANPAIYKSLPYAPLKDIVDVALLGMTPYVMIAAKGGAYPTLRSLIDAARAKPGEIPFASAGVGRSEERRAGCRHKNAAHPLQGLARGDPGHDRGTHFFLHGAARRLHRAPEGRQDHRVRGLHGATVPGRAGHSHAGRAGLDELQFVPVVRLVGASRNAARHRPEAERPSERDPAR